MVALPLLSSAERPCSPPHFLRRESLSLLSCLYIYSGRASQSADCPWHHQAYRVLIPPCPLPTSLQLCSSVPPSASRQRLPANRRSTRWTRRIIFVEGRDWDRSSHNSPHHQYFAPSREANNSLSLIQIIISRIWQLAHLNVLRKELQQKGLSQESHYISHRFVNKFLTYLSDYLISGC